MQLSFLDHVLSICNVSNRCLFSFPSEIELAEEQVYLETTLYWLTSFSNSSPVLSS